MGKKRAGQAKAGPQVKVSVVVPEGLYAKVEQARRLHGLTTSGLLRKAIEVGVEAWLTPEGVPAGASQQQEGGGAVTLPLTAGLLQALDAACTYWGLDRRAIVQLLLAENLGEFLERGREKYEQLRHLPAPPTRAGDEPEPA